VSFRDDNFLGFLVLISGEGWGKFHYLAVWYLISLDILPWAASTSTNPAFLGVKMTGFGTCQAWQTNKQPRHDVFWWFQKHMDPYVFSKKNTSNNTKTSFLYTHLHSSPPTKTNSWTLKMVGLAPEVSHPARFRDRDLPPAIPWLVTLGSRKRDVLGMLPQYKEMLILILYQRLLLSICHFYITHVLLFLLNNMFFKKMFIFIQNKCDL